MRLEIGEHSLHHLGFDAEENIVALRRHGGVVGGGGAESGGKRLRFFCVGVCDEQARTTHRLSGGGGKSATHIAGADKSDFHKVTRIIRTCFRKADFRSSFVKILANTYSIRCVLCLE